MQLDIFAVDKLSVYWISLMIPKSLKYFLAYPKFYLYLCKAVTSEIMLKKRAEIEENSAQKL